MSISSDNSYGMGQDETLLSGFMLRTVANSAAYVLSSIKADMKILDVGCGPGSITLDFARLVPQGHATGLDTAAASGTLARARAHAAAEGVTNVDFVVGDALALPFADATFDVTHAHQLLLHLRDPVRALREMRRVTRPGGVVAVREVDAFGVVMQPLPPVVLAHMQLLGRMTRENGTNTVVERALRESQVRQAGFAPEGITMGSGTWVLRMREERALWGMPMVGAAENSDFSSAALEKGYVTEEELKGMAQAWRDWIANDEAHAEITHIEMLCRV